MAPYSAEGTLRLLLRGKNWTNCNNTSSYPVRSVEKARRACRPVCEALLWTSSARSVRALLPEAAEIRAAHPGSASFLKLSPSVRYVEALHGERLLQVEWEDGGTACTLSHGSGTTASAPGARYSQPKPVSVLWQDQHSSTFDCDWLKRRCFSAAARRAVQEEFFLNATSEDPEAFHNLSNLSVDFTDTGTDYCSFRLQAKHRVIDVNSEGTVTRINLNNATRDSVLDLPVEHVQPFYRALKALEDMMNREENMVTLRMEPG
ncbi:hypothetical protein WMY93_013190 [Mugilogobius chulae]|uniref:Uncharacterized protein n=1 Tax=Mugilogobius chulae TaxID=88201 RepID=A0AAW0P2P8_9GOBI